MHITINKNNHTIEVYSDYVDPAVFDTVVPVLKQILESLEEMEPYHFSCNFIIKGGTHDNAHSDTDPRA